MFVGAVFCLFRAEQRKPIKILKSERTSLVIIDACFIGFMAKDVLTAQHRGSVFVLLSQPSLVRISPLPRIFSKGIYERSVPRK